jgi:hypothetical protein
LLDSNCEKEKTKQNTEEDRRPTKKYRKFKSSTKMDVKYYNEKI